MDIDEQSLWSAFSTLISTHLREPAAQVNTWQTPTAVMTQLPNLPDVSQSQAHLFGCIDYILQNSVQTQQPYFFNQLFAGRDMPAVLGDCLKALLNTSMYTYEMAPLATLMEQQLIEKMGMLAGFRQTEGIFVGGGSQANLIAMVLARHRCMPDIQQQGQRAPLLAFVSDQAHYSFSKAAMLMGLGTTHLIKVASDNHGRMRPDALQQAIVAHQHLGTPFFVGATAGTTVLGAFDPISDIAAVARAHDLWCHVDGAYGAPVLLHPEYREWLTGIDMVDSLTWDAHKIMGVPLTCSLLLTNAQPGLLKDAFNCGGDSYIFHTEPHCDYDTGPASMQCGRAADVLKLWLSWQAQGQSGFAARITHAIEHAKEVGRLIESDSRFELRAPVQYANACFQVLPPTGVDPDRFQRALRQASLESGRFMINQAWVNGASVFRLITVNPHTRASDWSTLMDELYCIGEDVLAHQSRNGCFSTEQV